MCATCHEADDPKFPSLLRYRFERPRCNECHAKLENPDVSWVDGRERTVGIVAGAGLERARTGLHRILSRDLVSRGFVVTSQSEPDFILSPSIRFTTTRDERFAGGGIVAICRIEAVLRIRGAKTPFFRRIFYSKPCRGNDGFAACDSALEDASRVLMPHLLNALGTN